LSILISFNVPSSLSASVYCCVWVSHFSLSDVLKSSNASTDLFVSILSPERWNTTVNIIENITLIRIQFQTRPISFQRRELGRSWISWTRWSMKLSCPGKTQSHIGSKRPKISGKTIGWDLKTIWKNWLLNYDWKLFKNLFANFISTRNAWTFKTYVLYYFISQS